MKHDKLSQWAFPEFMQVLREQDLLVSVDPGIFWCRRAGRRRYRGGSTRRRFCLHTGHSQLYLQVINSVKRIVRS